MKIGYRILKLGAISEFGDSLLCKELFMRFIFNFIFFGILFYVIAVNFPEAFKTLVSWADGIVTFFRETFQVLMDRLGTMSHTPPPPSPPAPPTL
jgi:hypothetical protein